MEMFLSALIGELASRSINFFINKITKLKEMDMEVSLQRVLLQAQNIIDEAIGRHITNEAMLQQLDMLRDAIYQGNYVLDTFRYQSQDVEDTKDPVVSKNLSLSTENSSLHGICSSNRKTNFFQQLQYALDNLSSMILDVKELVIFLPSYPRLYRQPYNMHLLLSNCMFGRQMEAQLVISFLLHTQSRGFEELEVLPIVGPHRVGKRTLVSHVCKDERVREHFSEILLLRGHDFAHYDHARLSKECAMENRNNMLKPNKDQRLLVVIELVDDLNDDALNKLWSSYTHHVPRGSKIIVTSRSDKIIKFGTTTPLCLKYLSPEAYWYFFKTLTFESMDPNMHPRFANVAMEIARMLGVCLIGANFVASLLRTNIDIHFWWKVLTFLRGINQKNISTYGGVPFHLVSQNKPAHIWRMASPSEDLVLHSQFHCSSHEEVPKINISDVLFGNIKPHGKFDLLTWSSQIPPYYSYVMSCEIRERKTTGTKRKRSANKTGICL